MFRLNDEDITRIEKLYEAAMQTLDENDYRLVRIWSETDDEEHRAISCGCTLEAGEGVEELIQAMLKDDEFGDGYLLMKNLMIMKTTPDKEAEDWDNWGYPYFVLEATMGETGQRVYAEIMPCVQPKIFFDAEYDYMVINADNCELIEAGSVLGDGSERPMPGDMFKCVVGFMGLENVRNLNGYERSLVDSLFLEGPARENVES